VRGDEVTLANGDRVTGSIVKKDDKTLTMKSEIFGTLTMPWDKVKTVRTDAPINVVLTGGETIRGTVSAEGEKLAIQEENRRREAALADVSALRDAAEQRQWERLQSPPLTALWAGTVTFGLAGAQGNAETRTLVAGLDAARVTTADKITVYLKGIRSSALIDRESEVTAQAVRGGWGYSRNLTRRLALQGFNDYEYDRFQNLDLRVVLGGGLAYSLWKSERGSFDLLGGGAYNREKFSPPLLPSFVRNSGEVYVGDDFIYKFSAVTSIYQNLRFFLNPADTDRHRFNFDAGATTKLAQWLSWNISVSNRYLNAPVVGRKKNDFLYTTGLNLTFAR
jgi:hypothetical protein